MLIIRTKSCSQISKKIPCTQTNTHLHTHTHTHMHTPVLFKKALQYLFLNYCETSRLNAIKVLIMTQQLERVNELF
jgi:hypothetical protein